MSDPVNTSDDVRARRAALVAARETIDREIAMLDGTNDSAKVTPVHEVSDAVPDWQPLKEAGGLFGCSDRRTILSKVKAHGLGRMIDGRWFVDVTRGRAWREGKPYTRVE